MNLKERLRKFKSRRAKKKKKQEAEEKKDNIGEPLSPLTDEQMGNIYSTRSGRGPTLIGGSDDGWDD